MTPEIITEIIKLNSIPHFDTYVGLETYATVCRENSKKTGFVEILTPTKGILTHTAYKEKYESEKSNEKGKYKQNMYFVPLRKNATSEDDLAWTKARNAHNLYITKTENEGWCIFAITMKQIIRNHHKRIQELYNKQNEILEHCSISDPDLRAVFLNMITESECYTDTNEQFSLEFEQYLNHYLYKKGLEL